MDSFKIFTSSIVPLVIYFLNIFSMELSETLGDLKESKRVYKRQKNEVESGSANIKSDKASINDVNVLYKATKFKIKLIRALIEKHASMK